MSLRHDIGGDFDESRCRASRRDEMTCDVMTGGELAQLWYLLVGCGRRLRMQRATCVEATARRWCKRARQVAVEHDLLARALHDRIRDDGSGQERLRVRMLRIAEELGA